MNKRMNEPTIGRLELTKQQVVAVVAEIEKSNVFGELTKRECSPLRRPTTTTTTTAN